MSEDQRPKPEYEDYELPLESKQNLKEIERCVTKGLYESEDMCRDHIDILEKMDAEISNALENERQIAHYNSTLKHDQTKVRNLMKSLEVKLRELDESEYD
jgi:hypothetical protein